MLSGLDQRDHRAGSICLWPMPERQVQVSFTHAKAVDKA